MDDDCQIEAELQHNYHLLACSSLKLLDRSSPKFYTYSGIIGAIKSCIYKALVHSVSERQSDISFVVAQGTLLW